MNYLPGSGALCVWWLGVEWQMPPQRDNILAAVFPWAKCPTRFRNTFERMGNQPATFGEMLDYGRFRVHMIPGLGEISLSQLDEIMERHGLGENWYNS